MCVLTGQVLLDGLLHASEAGRTGGVGQGVLISPWDGLLHVVLLRKESNVCETASSSSEEQRPCQLADKKTRSARTPNLQAKSNLA